MGYGIVLHIVVDWLWNRILMGLKTVKYKSFIGFNYHY